MSLWNKDLIHALKRSERKFENMFDRINREFYSPDIFKSENGFTPKIEIKESDNNILLCAEIPGIDEKDIQVTLKNKSLILEGEKTSERKKETKGFSRSEFNYGNFYRSIPLNSEIDPGHVEAIYKNGILRVTLKKLGETKQHSKRIEIKH